MTADCGQRVPSLLLQRAEWRRAVASYSFQGFTCKKEAKHPSPQDYVLTEGLRVTLGHIFLGH